MSDSTQPIYVHKLAGCRSRPLAHYLKALGVLRLVSEQADATARGFWRDDAFSLVTALDGDDLAMFFLDAYKPTPILAPWNGGSGFFASDKKTGIDPIRGSATTRFAALREAIAQAEAALAGRATKLTKGDEKNEVIRACRDSWRGPARAWLDAAIVLDVAGEPGYPALLGTGGNDGRLDFTNNYMQRLVEIFGLGAKGDAAGELSADADAGLRAALWGTDSPIRGDGAVGQFFPQAAGGANGSTGFSGGIELNPWDFVLMLEGAVTLGAGLSRRAEAAGLGQAVAPFAFRSVAVGSGSATESDAGPRGEQWMPLWRGPASYGEICQLFREARVAVDGRAAKDGLEMARAIAQRGVDRRLNGFERYAYMERNGQANLAVPLGRVRVPREVSLNQTLLNEVADWVERLRRAARDKVVPASVERVARLAGDAMFACTQADANIEGPAFRHLLLTLADAEMQLVRSPQFSSNPKLKLRPLSNRGGWPLSAGWIKVVRAGSPDQAAFRIALAISQQNAVHDNVSMLPAKDSRGRWPVRDHWVPLTSTGRGFETSDRGLRTGPDQSAAGRLLEADLLAVLRRRRLAMNGASAGMLPLALTNAYAGATLPDIAAFLAGEIDDAEVLRLARGLMAVDARGLRADATTSRGDDRPPTDLSLYASLRFSLPAPGMQLDAEGGGGGRAKQRTAGSILSLLEAGQTDRAFVLARRRLSASGHRLPFRLAVTSTQAGRRLAAAMAIPLRPTAFRALQKSVFRVEATAASS